MRKTKVKLREEPTATEDEAVHHESENTAEEDEVDYMIRMTQLQNDILLRIKENLEQDDNE